MNPFRRVYCHTKVSDSTGKQAREDIYYDPANPTQLYTAVPTQREQQSSPEAHSQDIHRSSQNLIPQEPYPGLEYTPPQSQEHFNSLFYYNSQSTMDPSYLAGSSTPDLFSDSSQSSTSSFSTPELGIYPTGLPTTPEQVPTPLSEALPNPDDYYAAQQWSYAASSNTNSDAQPETSPSSQCSRADLKAIQSLMALVLPQNLDSSATEHLTYQPIPSTSITPIPNEPKKAKKTASKKGPSRKKSDHHRASPIPCSSKEVTKRTKGTVACGSRGCPDRFASTYEKERHLQTVHAQQEAQFFLLTPAERRLDQRWVQEHCPNFFNWVFVGYGKKGAAGKYDLERYGWQHHETQERLREATQQIYAKCPKCEAVVGPRKDMLTRHTSTNKCKKAALLLEAQRSFQMS